MTKRLKDKDTAKRQNNSNNKNNSYNAPIQKEEFPIPINKSLFISNNNSKSSQKSVCFKNSDNFIANENILKDSTINKGSKSNNNINITNSNMSNSNTNNKSASHVSTKSNNNLKLNNKIIKNAFNVSFNDLKSKASSFRDYKTNSNNLLSKLKQQTNNNAVTNNTNNTNATINNNSNNIMNSSINIQKASSSNKINIKSGFTRKENYSNNQSCNIANKKIDNLSNTNDSTLINNSGVSNVFNTNCSITKLKEVTLYPISKSNNSIKHNISNKAKIGRNEKTKDLINLISHYSSNNASKINSNSFRTINYLVNSSCSRIDTKRTLNFSPYLQDFKFTNCNSNNKNIVFENHINFKTNNPAVTSKNENNCVKEKSPISNKGSFLLAKSNSRNYKNTIIEDNIQANTYGVNNNCNNNQYNTNHTQDGINIINKYLNQTTSNIEFKVNKNKSLEKQEINNINNKRSIKDPLNQQHQINKEHSYNKAPNSVKNNSKQNSIKLNKEIRDKYKTNTQINKTAIHHLDYLSSVKNKTTNKINNKEQIVNLDNSINDLSKVNRNNNSKEIESKDTKVKLNTLNLNLDKFYISERLNNTNTNKTSINLFSSNSKSNYSINNSNINKSLILNSKHVKSTNLKTKDTSLEKGLLVNSNIKNYSKMFNSKPKLKINLDNINLTDIGNNSFTSNQKPFKSSSSKDRKTTDSNREKKTDNKMFKIFINSFSNNIKNVNYINHITNISKNYITNVTKEEKESANYNNKQNFTDNIPTSSKDKYPLSPLKNIVSISLDQPAIKTFSNNMNTIDSFNETDTQTKHINEKKKKSNIERNISKDSFTSQNSRLKFSRQTTNEKFNEEDYRNIENYEQTMSKYVNPDMHDLNLMKFSYAQFLNESTTKSSKSDLNDII